MMPTLSKDTNRSFMTLESQDLIITTQCPHHCIGIHTDYRLSFPIGHINATSRIPSWVPKYWPGQTCLVSNGELTPSISYKKNVQIQYLKYRFLYVDGKLQRYLIKTIKMVHYNAMSCNVKGFSCTFGYSGFLWIVEFWVGNAARETRRKPG